MIRPSQIAVALFAALPLVAWGQHDHSQHQTAADKPSATEAKHHPQKLCPVSGKPVDESVSATVNGRKVLFCCPDCIDKYKADPDKYGPALYKQLYPQRVQVACPVMGGEIDPEVFVEHKGAKIYFCCKGCDAKFQKDPAKYEAGLKKAYTEQVHCPVMGGPIDRSISTEGKHGPVYFCCKDCVGKYEADPAKYEAAVLPAVGLLAHGEKMKDDLVRCAVCPPDKVHRRGEVKSVVYEGKTYFLCNDECAKKFQADPARFAKQMDKTEKTAADRADHRH